MKHTKLFLTASFIGLGLFFLYPLRAMEMDPEIERTNHNRSERERYSELGDHKRAAKFAKKVINPDKTDTQAPDNRFATVEDFRRARDICFAYGKRYNIQQELNDATSYVEGIHFSYEKEETSEDRKTGRDLHIEIRDNIRSAYFDALLPKEQRIFID